jgi:hypothetical protein
MDNLGLRAYETGSDHYRHVKFRFVKFDEKDQIRNIMSGYQDKPFEYFDDLEIHCQIGGTLEEGEELSPYSWGADYRDCYSIGLPAAEKMVKTLKRLEKGLAKLNEKLGRPETYADFVIRVANVLKVKAFVFPTTHNGDMFNDNDFRFEYSFSSAKHSINTLMDKSIEVLKGA